MTDTKISVLTDGGAIQPSDILPAVRGGANVKVTTGSAAAKGASDNTKATVASVSGTIVAGHLAVFADTGGTVQDGGAPGGSQGTAAAKAASDNSKATLASVPASVVAGHVATFADTAGTLQDGGALGTAALLTAGAANGVATLDGAGKVPNAQIPATTGGTLTDAATITWDGSIKVATVTLVGNRTLSLPSPLSVGRYALIVKQDGTGARTLTLGAGFKTPSGVVPTLSTGANAIDLLDIISDGTIAVVAAQYNFQ